MLCFRMREIRFKMREINAQNEVNGALNEGNQSLDEGNLVQYVSNLENGIKPIGRKMALKFADIFSVEPSKFF
jgi:hypothetical protein